MTKMDLKLKLSTLCLTSMLFMTYMQRTIERFDILNLILSILWFGILAVDFHSLVIAYEENNIKNKED